jgi:hypothetical protein
MAPTLSLRVTAILTASSPPCNTINSFDVVASGRAWPVTSWPASKPLRLAVPSLMLVDGYARVSLRPGSSRRIAAGAQQGSVVLGGPVCAHR